MKIFKYELEVINSQTLQLPADAVILSVKNQNEKICLWAIVDPDSNKLQDRRIRLFGTGHTFPDAYEEEFKFIGTVVQMGGQFVWHVFEDLILKRDNE